MTGGGSRERRQEALLELTTDDDVVDGNFEHAVRSITETAAAVLEATRVNVWLADEGSGRMQCVDHYDRRTDQHSAGMTLDASDYPAYFEALRTHRTIDAGDARADPRTRELAADYLDPHDVDALLDATLRDGGEVVGVVCHEQLGATREWTADEVQFAGEVADVVHRALRNQRSAEQRREIEFRRSLLKAQQEAIPDGVLVVGDEGEVLSYNDRFRELWGLPGEVLEEGTVGAVREHLLPQLANPEPVLETADYLYANPEASSHDEVRLADGRVFERFSTPVDGESGEHYGRLWTVRDITDRKEAVRQLQVLHRVLRHNLSNQMSIIRGSAEQLLDEGGAVEDTAATIVEEADRLLDVTDEHREIVRLLSERPAPRPVELDELLDWTVRALGEEFPGADVELDGPEVGTVHAIPAVETAVRELVTNAVVHSDRDSPSVAVRTESGESAVRVRVVDEGPGIPDEEAQVLTGGQTVDPLYHGLGMGLWLVYWIVSLSDGTVDVAANDPRGSVVTVELPRA